MTHGSRQPDLLTKWNKTFWRFSTLTITAGPANSSALENMEDEVSMDAIDRRLHYGNVRTGARTVTTNAAKILRYKSDRALV